MAAYRVQFTQQWSSFNPGETAYFDADVAGRLVAAGLGTALDALPSGQPAPPAGTLSADVVTDASPEATDAEQQAEAGVLPEG